MDKINKYFFPYYDPDGELVSSKIPHFVTREKKER